MNGVQVRRVASVLNGGTPTSDEDNWGGDVPWATPVDLAGSNGGELKSTERTLSSRGLSSGSSLAPADSILISTRAPIGYISIVRSAMSFNQGCKAIVPRHEGVPRFMQFALISQTETLKARGAGSTFQELSTEGLASTEIPFPHPGEQRRIADFLDDRVARVEQIVVARREQQTARESLFESQKEAALYNATETPAVELRRLRCVVQTGPFGSQLHSDEYVDGGWPVVNPACISDGRIRQVPGMSVDTAVRQRLARHILVKDDVVFGRRGEMGRAGLVTQSEIGWVCGTGSLLVRLTDERMRPAFLMQLLSTSRIRYYFQRQSVGSTMDNLNTDILLSVPLTLPTLQQQDAILGELDELAARSDAALRNMEASISLLTEYKQALITAAVTGELDVTTAGSGIPG